MPLQQLVEYFNDRLEWEHHSNFRPFFLHDGVVQGLFGPIRIGSELAPLRQTLRLSAITGYAARLNVTAAEMPHMQSHELAQLVSLPAQQGVNPESIVNFDRLARTVHMLNFLPLSHLDDFLQLDVDPRHILGVKKDHGAYFQDVIIKCGLQPKNIIITMSVNSLYAAYYEVLLKGLENYRGRHYRLALKFDYHALGSSAMDLISILAPDFVCLQSAQLANIQDNQSLEKLNRLNALTRAQGGQTIMLHVNDRKIATLARKTGFNLVQGDYYEQCSSQDYNQSPRSAAGGR